MVSCDHCLSACGAICTKQCFGNGCLSSGCDQTCLNSCGNSCKGNCKGGCLLTCKGNCKGGCLLTCKDECGNGCTGSCKGSCTGSCKGSCTGSCGNGCTGSCKGSCTGSCSNCSGSCRGSCTGGCGDSCAKNCSIACTTQCTGEEMQKIGDIIALLNDATKENLFKADDINLIAQGIVYECTKRQYTPTNVSFTVGEPVDDGKIEILIKNLQMIYPDFYVEEIGEGRHPWNIKTRKTIVEELQRQWKATGPDFIVNRNS